MRNFLNVLIDILPVVLSALLTGLFTFWITIYKYNKNIPLDKLEVAYNRVYYPVIRAISDEKSGNDMDYVIKRIKPYFDKYGKYVNNSTMDLFYSLCNKKTPTEKKYSYRSFVANINDQNKYLRKRLGYLNSTQFQSFKYKDKSKIQEMLLFVGAVAMNMLTIMASYLDKEAYSYEVLTIIIGFLLFIVAVIYIALIVNYLWREIRICIEKHKIKKSKTS